MSNPAGQKVLAAVKAAHKQGLITEYGRRVKADGVSDHYTLYFRRDGEIRKVYTESALDTLVQLARLGFRPNN